MPSVETQASETPASRSGDDRTPLPLRGDTLLGVCEAVGQDLGFNPNWLRVAFSALLLWNPTVIVGSYLALGAVVALTRWKFADKSAAPAVQQAGETVVVEQEERRLAA